jgi:hypothetical protein
MRNLYKNEQTSSVLQRTLSEIVTNLPKLSEVTAELAELRRQQQEETTHATFIGWNPDISAAHQRRADRIAVLLAQLANCGD